MKEQEPNSAAAVFILGAILFLIFFSLISFIMFNMRAMETISNL